MAIEVQYRRGSTAQNDAFTGAVGEVTVDTTNSTIRVHNGSTPGGVASVGVTSQQTLTNKTLANVAVTGNIINSNANGVGNIGNSTGQFNTIFAKATSAQYADLAEKYLADQPHTPGTVLEIGGPAEVCATTMFASCKIAGIVSTNPAFIMNATLDTANTVELALIGRVPCKVVGTITKGDLLCSSDIPGVATALPADKYVPGCVLGKALEDYADTKPGVIEVLVGRL